MDDFEIELKNGFLDEARELLMNAEQCFLTLETSLHDPQILEQILRLAHNLKGSAGAVGFHDLKDLTHRMESLLVKIKKQEVVVTDTIISLLLACNDHMVHSVESLKSDLSFSCQNSDLIDRLEKAINGDHAHSPGENSRFVVKTISDRATGAERKIQASNLDENIRVNLSKIDHLLNIMGELVILQTVMDQQKHQAHAPLLQKTVGQMSKIIKEAQTLSMNLRMLPLKQTFQKMQRIVRDTSKQLGKVIEFTFNGEDTELDKTVIEQLADPLVHLVRNAIDHGVETPEQRKAQGKDAFGRISMYAQQRGGQILIEVKDDGRGIDCDRLIEKAKKLAIIAEHQVLSREEAYELIFASGLTTKEQLSDVSGRGVGMDIVKNHISQLQGNIAIESEPGKGTCFRITLPLTLAIIDGMVLQLGNERYVVPIAQVHESLKPQTEDVSTINNTGEVLNLRGQYVPLYRLDRLLGRKDSRWNSVEEGIALIIRDDHRSFFAILVNDILCQQQVVIKNLGEEVAGYPGFSGAAILGDGKAGIILDLLELTANIRRQTSSAAKNINRENHSVQKSESKAAG